MISLEKPAADYRKSNGCHGLSVFSLFKICPQLQQRKKIFLKLQSISHFIIFSCYMHQKIYFLGNCNSNFIIIFTLIISFLRMIRRQRTKELLQNPKWLGYKIFLLLLLLSAILYYYYYGGFFILNMHAYTYICIHNFVYLYTDEYICVYICIVLFLLLAVKKVSVFLYHLFIVT